MNEMLEYENSMEDWVQFQIFHVKHSPSGTAKRKRNALAAAVVGFLVFTGLAAIGGNWTPAILLTAALFAALTAALSWPVTMLAVRKRAARLYADGEERGLLGRHKLTLTAEALNEENSKGSRTDSFDSIERVRVTEDYVYIYVGPESAHVIPNDKVMNGDLGEFLTTLAKRRRAGD